MKPVNQPMNDHPSDEELDALRAGLYDDRTDPGKRIGTHLDDCPACRARLQQWSRALEPLQAGDAWLDSALRQRRRAALAGEGAQHRTRPWRLAAALAAGLTGVALGLGVVLHAPGPTDSLPRAQAPVVGEVPDLYADIDFYLWLMRKDQPEDGSNG